jgi:alkaline phosphatase D
MKFSRRTLLSAGPTAAAAAFLAACSDSGSKAFTSATTPGASATSGSIAASATSAPPSTAATTTSTTLGEHLPADPFGLGVASGDPLPTSVILWTRLTVATKDQPVPMAWEVASDEGFTKIVSSGIVNAEAASAFAVHVDATKLPSDSWFFYRFKAGGYISPVGRTRTMPAEGAAVKSFTFAAASCQHFESGFYAAHRDIAEQKPDAVLFLGDYIYEYESQPIDPTKFVFRSHNGPRPITLDQYRQRYARYKGDPQLQAAHAATPWVCIWDDHEVENNYASNNSERNTAPEAFTAQRAAAYQAWWEHMPTRLASPKPGSVIYREFAIGSLANVFMLDGRQFRTDQACNDKVLSADPPCAETFDEARTMLGAEQEKWLLDGLKASKSTWDIIGNQTILSDITLNNAVLNYDQWDGYPAARKRLVDGIAAIGRTSTVVVTGDIHLAGVADVTTAQPDQGGRTVATEFVSTSISSTGNLPDGADKILGSFKTVKYAEAVKRGYTMHTVTPTSWTAVYRSVEDISRADSPVITAATFTVAPGTPGATRVMP